MQWRQTVDPSRRCPKWVPKPWDDATQKMIALGETATADQVRLNAAKRRRASPAELRDLKTAVTKAQNAYDEQNDLARSVHVFVLGRAHGFCVLRGDTGSTIHALCSTLEEAQREAEKMLEEMQR